MAARHQREQEDAEYDFKVLLNDSLHFSNLVIMNVAWSGFSFGFFLINSYMKYIPGDIYTNVIYSSLADLFSTFFAAYLSKYLGNQKALIISFFISGVFAFALVFQPTVDDEQLSYTLLALVILTKLGVCSASNICSLITAEYFPVKYASSVFGFCSIAARFTTILAPLVAEMEAPTPMLILSAFALCTIFFVERLKK